MAPSYRHVASGRVVAVREDTLLARLVAADAGYEQAPDVETETVEETVVVEDVDPGDEVVTEDVETETVEETVVVEEGAEDAGNGGGRRETPRTHARRRGGSAS